MIRSYAINKICGVDYPIHFLKSMGSVTLVLYSLGYKTKKASHFARRNDCYALLAIKNQIVYSVGIFSCSCSPIFETLTFLSQCKCGSRASSDCIVYLNEK